MPTIYTATRAELGDGKDVTVQLDKSTDYEFLLSNNTKSQVYFTLESTTGKRIFESASLRTTTSDSGSNVLGFVTESNHASGIMAANSTSSFLVSSAIHNIPGNNFKVKASNPKVHYHTGSTVFGVDLEIKS